MLLPIEADTFCKLEAFCFHLYRQEGGGDRVYLTEALHHVAVCKSALLFFGFFSHMFRNKLQNSEVSLSSVSGLSHTTKLINAKSPILVCIHPGILKRLKNVKIELLTKMGNLSLKSAFQLQE